MRSRSPGRVRPRRRGTGRAEPLLRERYAEKLQIGVLSHERFQIVNHDVGTTSVKGPVAALKGE